MGTRPRFLAAWTAAKNIYDPNDPLGKVKNTIGGAVNETLRYPPNQVAGKTAVL